MKLEGKTIDPTDLKFQMRGDNWRNLTNEQHVDLAAKDILTSEASQMSHFTPTPDEIIERAKGRARGLRNSVKDPEGQAHWSAVEQRLEAMKPQLETHQGKMYEVSIKADPDQFLDWDKPLSQQSKAVQEAISKHSKVDPRYWFQEHFIDASGNVRGPVGDLKVTDEMRDALGKVGTTIQKPADLANGQTLYHHLREGGYPGDASEQLKDLGIPGIKYLDQGSRGPATTYDVGAPRPDFGPYSPYTNRADAEKQLALLKQHGFHDAEIKTTTQKGTSNYVVFDDKLIEILKKYAVAGAVGGSLASLGQPPAEEQK
jgi:hypothetical protein